MTQQDLSFPADRHVRINGVLFEQGTATGVDCNCLIDTLRQCLNISDISIVDSVRNHLETTFCVKCGPDRVRRGDYLQLDFHWQIVIMLLGANPELYKIICADWVHKGNGEVVGTGSDELYIARVDENHFVPLQSVQQ